MDNDIMEQIKSLLEIDRRQKCRLNELAMAHREWDPILRHDMIHHSMLQDVLPEQYKDETVFEYHTRLLAVRRRLDAQTRLAGCLLMALKEGV